MGYQMRRLSGCVFLQQGGVVGICGSTTVAQRTHTWKKACIVNRKSSDAEKSLEIKSSICAPLENPTPARERWYIRSRIVNNL